MKKKLCKLKMRALAAVLLMLLFCGAAGPVYGVSGDTTGDYSDSSESHDRYSSATSTNPFILPGNTWVAPVATHGQDVIVVLPIVNMFKYNLQDVIVTPVLASKTDDWPFEIDITGYTEKIDLLVGEEAQPNPAERVRNCVWLFRTRENVKTGYYKLDFNIVYTNPACVIETVTISTYVHTIGLPENGTTDGDDANKKTSTPRLIVKGFTTEPAEVYSGSDFMLHLVIENTSDATAVRNLQLDLTATVEGTSSVASYAAFLPTSGSNSFYVEKIPPGGQTQLDMEFQAKSGLEQKPYVMDIKMVYEDEKANPYEGTGSVSIPVKQVSKFDMGTPTVEPSQISIGEQANVMFSIYNTGKTTLYNVQVTVEDPSVKQELSYVGNLSAGATGNVDMMVTGQEASPEESEGKIPIIISYEDEAGNVTKTEKQIDLTVTEAMEETVPEEYAEMPEEDTGKKKKIWIIAGAALLLLILIIIIVKLVKRHKRKKEEAELARIEEDEEELIQSVRGALTDPEEETPHGNKNPGEDSRGREEPAPEEAEPDPGEEAPEEAEPDFGESAPEEADFGGDDSTEDSQGRGDDGFDPREENP
ncbi:MAG: hypothetical protein K6F35_02220 [Lachnospiraceae bacterium]|nr:hypothetical protein [Lachnospiraceae bacterium]